MKKTVFALGLALLLSVGLLIAQTVQVDSKMPDYQPASGISGTLSSVGSDTLNNVMTLWAEGFKARYPNVKIQIEGKGSSTAPPALIEGTSQLGPMSREMKSTEVDAFEKKYGYKPTQIKVAIDTLAVYVHKDNPIKGLTLQQLDGIFSSTYKRGGKNITTWGQLGLTGEWANKPISLYGRNSASGTYGFFKEHALNNGDYKATVKEQPGSSSVVQGVSNDLGAIGYSGIGYKTSGVRTVPLSKATVDFFEANYDTAMNGYYPLTRFLYVYTNKSPNAPMDKLVSEFIRFILSKDGQMIVIKDGYYPLPLTIDTQALSLLAGK